MLDIIVALATLVKSKDQMEVQIPPNQRKQDITASRRVSLAVNGGS